jgi:hypothetical protein
MSGNFRKFLQSLKPGEIGFVIASVGVTSASVLTFNSLYQASKQQESDRRKQWKKRIADVKHLVSEGTPVEGLSTIKFYQARLREEARVKLGITDLTSDEICDEWLRRRNIGDSEALKVEHVRLRLKRFWHSIESAAQYRIQELEAPLETTSTHVVKAESSETTSVESSNVLKELLGGGMNRTEANDRLVQKTLMFLERLDIASCRNHPKCVWSTDQPSFYSFLRKQFSIDDTWPSPDTNPDDFTIDAPTVNSPEYKNLYNRTPESRLAQMMEQRKNRHDVWKRALGAVEAGLDKNIMYNGKETTSCRN